MYLRALALIFLALATSGKAFADSRPYNLEWWLGPPTFVQVDSGNQWRLNAGLGAVYAPDYFGGDMQDAEFLPLPLLDVEWRETVFVSTKRGAGIHLFRRKNIRAGFRVTPDLGRDSSVNSLLSPLEDIEAAPEYGLFAEGIFGSARLHADVRKAFSGHEGIIGTLGAAFGSRLAATTSLFVRGRVRFADEDYLESYFGVPANRAGPGLNAFSPEAGLLNGDIGASVVWHFYKRAYVSFDFTGGLMLGDAADSPIVTDELYGNFSVVLGYKF